ncbi:heparinase [Clostridium botulinum]|uniref:Heparinase n=1 Tax=Clostridium botulinum TaxID=1491 RepID=A0A9Q1UW12_CLOBO|nr:heparinase II/III family protein [Clostridium botulinum]AEB76478.1 putative heparinase II/III-like protein [Clostridium botulinum BKT015925]KEI04800.1 heparinase [Clostridium botulinum C/D str. Sp77]KOA79859.1 heparinase [Clostridium botulinum]KOA81636.1 heparinase [Clostridium botulinum]KOA82346.1 heparinase [Clostridium botulinum]
MKNSLFILRKNSSNFIKNFNIPKVREYTLKNFKSDCKTLIAKANLLIDNTFVFKEKWDMEQCHTPYKLKNINWIQSPNGDEEWIFMLNRQDYLYNLIIAFYLTNEYKYLDKWKYLVLDWIDKNKINPSNPLPSCRTIDTGIRCLNWTLSLALIAHNNYFTDAELTKIIHSIDSQNNFLKEKFIDKHRIVNWGVLQTTGMLSSLILTKETPYENEIFKWALNKYNEQLTLQIFDDGIQWEQSPMYHVEVLLSTLKLLHLCREFNISLTNNIEKTTLKMSKTLLYTTKPNFHQVMQSDSDDTDTRDILVKSAMLFNDSELKFRGYEKADFESAWLFGYNFINSYNKITPKNPV